MASGIAKGVPLRELWAEFFGRVTATCKGKGGPMHITHPASGLMVTTGLVGAGLPIALGFAVASVHEGRDRVTVVNFGDGATSIGAFHEALNLAALWNLPVVCGGGGLVRPATASGVAHRTHAERLWNYARSSPSRSAAGIGAACVRPP